MAPVHLILLVAAFVLFGISAFWVAVSARVNLVALGLALWVLSEILH